MTNDDTPGFSNIQSAREPAELEIFDDGPDAAPVTIGNPSPEPTLETSENPAQESNAQSNVESNALEPLGGEQAGRPAAAREISTVQRIFSGSGPISREDLMERGITGPEADAVLVQRHREEVLMERFRRWYLCFICTLCLLTPAMFGIFIWMLVELGMNFHRSCDVPLQIWVLAVCGAILHNFCCGRWVTKWLCRWSPGSAFPRRPPLRVRLFQGFVVLSIFSWNFVGLYWVGVSGSLESDEPSCRDEVPGLSNAVLVYSALNIAWTAFMYVNHIGLSFILRAMMRAGVLRTGQAAPKGALEQNTTPVTLEDEIFKENPTCSVCLDDFDDAQPIIKTNNCNHVFHKQCLAGWLQVNRNCPLCREDLGKIAETE